MPKRRELILETARRLFAEKGYDGVSMRDIAGELGISVGNVTYYFKKKEDLIETSILEQSQSYHLPATPSSLIELDQLFAYICQGVLERLYYFYHYTQMSQISPRVHELQRAYTKDLYLTLKNACVNLQKSGDMVEDAFQDETEYFVRGLMTAVIYWAPHNNLMTEGKSQCKEEFMRCLWSLVFPKLTEKGKQTCWSRILKKLYQA